MGCLDMFCTNCGTQLTDDAKFCSNCGAPVSGTASASGGSTQTAPEGPRGISQEQPEYIEMRQEADYSGAGRFLGGLVTSSFGWYHYRLEAIAAGPFGRYHVAYSPHFITNEEVSMGGGQGAGEPALAALTDDLIRDGWEPLPGGPLWWQARFQRRVAAERQGPAQEIGRQESGGGVSAWRVALLLLVILFLLWILLRLF
jgi:hypothetical protein